MATKKTSYLTVPESIVLHIVLMRSWQEIYFGVDRRDVLESAIARPEQAATYENADVVRQAATLCFGLVKNHPWLGGNKRTATFLTEYFLGLNNLVLMAETREIVDFALRIEADDFRVDEIESWLRARVLSTS